MERVDHDYPSPHYNLFSFLTNISRNGPYSGLPYLGLDGRPQYCLCSCTEVGCFAMWESRKSPIYLTVITPRRVTVSARYTAPRYDATPLLREQSVTFIAPRNTMETIASSVKSAKN
ncbi:hypothetical protein J6590_008684 [Homalodisca vitripennis]|nr:hypothetical protein J6590_008684 [Homalodisca vitripennis]